MASSGKTTPLFSTTTTKNVVLVKPSHPTPSHFLSFSTIDNDPYVETICRTLYVYRSKVESSSSDPAAIIKQGLSRALVYYYPLAGKLKRRADGTLQITCNADGVPFADATMDCTLDSLNYLDGIYAQTAQLFLLDSSSDGELGYHPLALQVTKFSCGGFVLGMELSHSVCDGFGAAQFFRAMAELSSGQIEPSVKPVWERERLVGSPNNQQHKFQGLDGMFSCLAKSPFVHAAMELSHECFDIDSDSINQLKSCHDQPFTTIEILGAYVWRSRFRALKQSPDGMTILHVALGIRNLWNPPLPGGFYGNAFVPARVVITGRDLDNEPLSKVAKLIKESKKTASQGDYIKECLDFSETFRGKKMKIDESGASLMLTDWRQLKMMEEVDFGWGGSVNMVPVLWDMIGFMNLCFFLPPNRLNPSMEGGVRVLVSLPKDAMPAFKQQMDALKIR